MHRAWVGRWGVGRGGADRQEGGAVRTRGEYSSRESEFGKCLKVRWLNAHGWNIVLFAD